MSKQIKFPKLPLDKILAVITIAMISLFIAALISRSKSIIKILEFLDVATLLALLGLGAFVLVKRYKK